MTGLLGKVCVHIGSGTIPMTVQQQEGATIMVLYYYKHPMRSCDSGWVWHNAVHYKSTSTSLTACGGRMADGWADGWVDDL